MDLSKAFDTINDSLVLEKLDAFEKLDSLEHPSNLSKTTNAARTKEVP